MGDGTGCDNMTCVIVKFKDYTGSGEVVEAEKTTPADKEASSDEPASAAAKRPADESGDEPQAKRRCD